MHGQLTQANAECYQLSTWYQRSIFQNLSTITFHHSSTLYHMFIIY